MKNIKTILISGILTLGVFSMITYTSCSKKDPCDSINCKNGGTCAEGNCKCPLGYEGINCESASTSKFIGSFSAVDNCPVADTNRNDDDLKYTLTIIADGSSVKKVYVSNLANASSQPSYTLTANLTKKNELTIEPETLPDGRTYSGTITYKSSGKLSASFQVKVSGNVVEACASSLSKK